MKLTLNKHHTTLILVAFLVVSFTLIPKAYPKIATAQEKSLTFLEEVVNLDLTKYTVKLDNYADAAHLEMSEENVVYTLNKDNESKLHVLCKFRDYTLSSCIIDVLEGSQVYAEAKSTDALDLAKDFLQKYQSFAGASYLQAMRNILDTVKEEKNTTTATGDVKFTLSIEGIWTDPADEPITDTTFEWTQTVNGVDVPQNALTVSFRDGSLYWFRDDWNLYTIGNRSINVSKDEAIKMAIDAARDYKLQVYTAEDTLKDIEFKIAEEHLTAEIVMYPKGTLTLNPLWQIQLYFDKYYASYFGIEVGIWADTEEILYCQATGTSGGLPYGKTPTTLPTNHSLLTPINMTIIGIALATIIGTTIAAVAVKKKHK